MRTNRDINSLSHVTPFRVRMIAKLAIWRYHFVDVQQNPAYLRQSLGQCYSEAVISAEILTRFYNGMIAYLGSLPSMYNILKVFDFISCRTSYMIESQKRLIWYLASILEVLILFLYHLSAEHDCINSCD